MQKRHSVLCIGGTASGHVSFIIITQHKLNDNEQNREIKNRFCYSDLFSETLESHLQKYNSSRPVWRTISMPSTSRLRNDTL